MNALQLISTQQDSTPSPELQHKILLSAYVGMTLSGTTTVLRLALRMRYFGWDDALAGLALLSLIITAIVGKLYFDIDASSTRPQSSRVTLYYIFAVTFDTTVWISRLSILFTIIRLGGYKKQLYVAATYFLLALLVLIAQVFWVCEPQNRHNHWKEDIVPQCVLGESVAITQIASESDALADIVLIAYPLYLLRYLKSEDAKPQKMRLAVSFVVGGLTSVVSVVHAVYLLNGSKTSLLVSNIEMVVSVTIANFAVLVAAWYRLWKLVRPKSKSGDNKETQLSSMAYGAPPSGTSASDQDQVGSEGGTSASVVYSHSGTTGGNANGIVGEEGRGGNWKRNILKLGA
ncbi:hypothetical protein D9757_006761 [Collybiopsis confluens]|uniref:Rhodopsin domain-containing protein n=1 Tax=Collybiopsis confluens TaxID=2823264 RepID=A0A8H5M9A3_9AGAR|nr:hypothetical protein D9757_006761 [Collybiopsis confluens]